MAGMPKMPGLSDLMSLLQQQTEALASLPRTMVDLNRSILSLRDVIASARDTMSATQRVSARLEQVVNEMEEPVLALKPGIERLAVILADPAVDTVPDTLRKINEDVMPLVQGMRDTQAKVNNIATLAEETSNRLAGLPGASLLLGRRGRQSAAEAGGPAQPAAEPGAELAPEQQPADGAVPAPAGQQSQQSPRAPTPWLDGAASGQNDQATDADQEEQPS